jgi:hypothetical protein
VKGDGLADEGEGLASTGAGAMPPSSHRQIARLPQVEIAYDDEM